MIQGKLRVIYFGILFYSLFGFMSIYAGIPIIEITGRVSVRGNEPFTYLGISTSDGVEYKISGKMKDKIRKQYQQQILNLKGMVIKSREGHMPAKFEVMEIVKILGEEE